MEQKVYQIALYSMVTRNLSVSDTFLYRFQSRALFVPDSQWNVYRIARHRVTDRRIWYKKLSDTKGIRYRVTEAKSSIYLSVRAQQNKLCELRNGQCCQYVKNQLESVWRKWLCECGEGRGNGCYMEESWR